MAAKKPGRRLKNFNVNVAEVKRNPMFEKLNSIIYTHLRQDSNNRKASANKLSKKSSLLSKKSTITNDDAYSPLKGVESPFKKKLTNASRESSLTKAFLKKGSGT